MNELVFKRGHHRIKHIIALNVRIGPRKRPYVLKHFVRQGNPGRSAASRVEGLAGGSCTSVTPFHGQRLVRGHRRLNVTLEEDLVVDLEEVRKRVLWYTLHQGLGGNRLTRTDSGHKALFHLVAHRDVVLVDGVVVSIFV